MTATTATKTPALGKVLDPATVTVENAQARAKDPVNRWSDRPKTGKVKVFVWLKDEATGTDSFEAVGYHEAPARDDYQDEDAYEAAAKAFWSKENRVWTANRRKVLDQVFAALGVDPGKVRFSRNAGCSCGCSPGFTTDLVGQHDVFVTATGKPAA